VHDAHAAPATASRRLDDHGIADLPGESDDLLRVLGQRTLGTGNARHPALIIATLALTLSPISRIVSGRGPMKTKPERSTFSAKSAFSDRKP